MKKGRSFVGTKIRWRNFMSFGDREMELSLTGEDIAVLLGENLDSSSEDARNGVGKAQPLDAKVLTPTGWRRMGDLVVGDKVIAADGRVTEIIGITDNPEPKPIMTFTTADGKQTRVDADHAWDVLTDWKPPKTLNSFFEYEEDTDPLQWRTLTTREIMDGIASGHEYHIPLHRPQVAEASASDLDPYDTGRLIEQEDRRLAKPRDYNARQRYMYLKGLLGYPRKGKRSALPDRFIHMYTNTPLGSEIQEVVWSLGGYCDRRPVGDNTQLEISLQNPYHTWQDATVRIKEIVQEGPPEPTRCILIRSKKHLYVTDDYIVTHNSSIIDALCYVLFGKTIRGIPNKSLVNKFVSKKPMYVEFEFEKGDYQYLVERGERPSILRLYRQEKGCKDPFKKKVKRKLVYDISRGKTETTDQILELLGYDITLFEYLVANSSKSDPFLKLKPPKQREVIEKLFGFEIMSQKGAVLSDQRKERRKELAVANAELQTVKAGNERIRSQIAELGRRSKAWEQHHAEQVDELESKVAKLEEIDYDEEIENLKLLADIEAEETRLTQQSRQTRRASDDADRIRRMAETAEKAIQEKIQDLKHQIEHMEGGVCPTCEQSWVPDEKALGGLRNRLDDARTEAEAKSKDVVEALLAATKAATADAEAAVERSQFDDMVNSMPELEFHFDTEAQAQAAKGRIGAMKERLEALQAETNPHTQSIDNLRSEALQDEDDSEVRHLEKVCKHLDFLVKLLTDSDSFIRKSILDLWVPNLNKRIHHYLRATDQPHKVVINPDLTVSISLHKEDYTYAELSNGEQTRLNIAVNFSFQDIFEHMNYAINILCIDEMIDNGLGPAEARAVVRVLKDLNAKKAKSVYLITHREDVAAQADRTFVVRKADDLSWIEQVQ